MEHDPNNKVEIIASATGHTKRVTLHGKVVSERHMKLTDFGAEGLEKGNVFDDMDKLKESPDHPLYDYGDEVDELAERVEHGDAYDIAEAMRTIKELE